jgi:hypothetical protein
MDSVYAGQIKTIVYIYMKYLGYDNNCDIICERRKIRLIESNAKCRGKAIL